MTNPSKKIVIRQNNILLVLEFLFGPTCLFLYIFIWTSGGKPIEVGFIIILLIVSFIFIYGGIRKIRQKRVIITEEGIQKGNLFVRWMNVEKISKVPRVGGSDSFDFATDIKIHLKEGMDLLLIGKELNYGSDKLYHILNDYLKNVQSE